MAIACTESIAPVFSFATGGAIASDEMLVGRIACSDKLAMQALFARHQVRVYRFILRIVQDEAVAEDVIIDTFLDVWRKATHVQAYSTVSTWLLTIANDKATLMLARQAQMKLDSEMAAVADQTDDPEIAFQRKHGCQALRQYLASLPPKHAQITDLVYYHGKSVSEVAMIGGIPEATVVTRMFRARKRSADTLSR
jgi:RNA polymerase sigma-70 factor, ECF subfamily